MSDAEYDEHVKRLVKMYYRLDEFRQWQLGDRDTLKHTGIGVCVTTQAAGAAVAALAAIGKHGRLLITTDWNWNKRRQVRWLTPDKFKFTPIRKRERLC